MNIIIYLILDLLAGAADRRLSADVLTAAQLEIIARLQWLVALLPFSGSNREDCSRKRGEIFPSDFLFPFSFLQSGPVQTTPPRPAKGAAAESMLGLPLIPSLLPRWDPQWINNRGNGTR
jgi:hypothetical protein